jgi:hypothetical protein
MSHLSEKRSNFKWQAYVSSALTSFPSPILQDNVINLNKKIQEWLENEADSFAYLPQDYSSPGHDAIMTPEEVYILDRWRIIESDFVIMNLDNASFGVGQEAEIATSAGVPIIAFHHHNIRISRMIRGIPGIYSDENLEDGTPELITYKNSGDYSDLKEKILDEIRKLQKLINPTIIHKSSYESFSNRLAKAIRNSSKTISKVAKETGFSERFINTLLLDYKEVESRLNRYELATRLSMKQVPFDRFTNPGIWIVQKLAASLNVSVSSLVGELTSDTIWYEPLRLISRDGVSLEEFVDVVSSNQIDYSIHFSKAARFIPMKQNEAAIAIKENILKFVRKNRGESE